MARKGFGPGLIVFTCPYCGGRLYTGRPRELRARVEKLSRFLDSIDPELPELRGEVGKVRWGEFGVRVVSFKVDDDLLWMLERIAKQKRLSKSELIRAAIRAYIEGEREKRPIVTKRIKIWG